MDNIRFGAFVAQLRKEQGMTQKELAVRLHVTDKAVSKWETGKGFPDVKLLEPLAQVLDISLVELIRGERQMSDQMTVSDAGAVVSQAMAQSQKFTARRYLGLFCWLLMGNALVCGWVLYPYARRLLHNLYFHFLGKGYTISLGSAYLAEDMRSPWLRIGLPAALLLLCAVLALRVRRLVKKLKRSFRFPKITWDTSSPVFHVIFPFRKPSRQNGRAIFLRMIKIPLFL